MKNTALILVIQDKNARSSVKRLPIRMRTTTTEVILFAVIMKNGTMGHLTAMYLRAVLRCCKMLRKMVNIILRVLGTILEIMKGLTRLG